MKMLNTKLINKTIVMILVLQVGAVGGNVAMAADSAGKADDSSPISCPWIKSALAAEEPMMGSVSIISPKTDAVLKSGAANKLEFDVKLGPNGNHVHIYVDNGSPIVDRDIGYCPCTIDLPKLSPGKHTIAVKEATSAHALTGAQASVTVMVK